MERSENPYLETLADFVGALGARLEINAVFEDEVVPLKVFEAEVETRRYSHSIVAGGFEEMSRAHAVDAADLVDDPVGDALQQVVGQPRPVGGHRVVGGDGADHDRVGVGAPVALDADRADDRQHAEGLPELPVHLGGADLLLQDRVGGAEDVEPFAVDLAADDADRQAGARGRAGARPAARAGRARRRPRAPRP